MHPVGHAHQQVVSEQALVHLDQAHVDVDVDLKEEPPTDRLMWSTLWQVECDVMATALQTQKPKLQVIGKVLNPLRCALTDI